jgi:hypothetical protein
MVTVAVIVVVPALLPVATPFWSIVATVVWLEVHVTPVAEDPFTVAVNCTVCPVEMVSDDGETVTPLALTLTVKLVLPLKSAWLAVIVVVPVATVVTTPELSMVATLVDEDFHSTEEEISLLELSPYVPMAVNC